MLKLKMIKYGLKTKLNFCPDIHFGTLQFLRVKHVKLSTLDLHLQLQCQGNKHRWISYLSRVTQNGPWVILFYQNVNFTVFWIYIILRLVREKFSRINVKISLLWGHKHGVYTTASFLANMTSWCSRNDTQIFTSVIFIWNHIYLTVTVRL